MTTNLIGRIFDRKYRLVRLIGEGGMGSVYEAEHTLIERKVAVKVMHPEFSSSKEIIDRFFREAQASSAIGHPNIIDVEDVGLEADGTAFIVMELLNGMSLSDRMKLGHIPADQAVSIILQVLSALVVAHEKGIIHRDLKPDNVFLAVDSRGRQEVKLLDFGIAKIQDDQGDQGLTKTGTVLGTPNYMSPEQARGKKVDARIDIWAAGVMLYEMLAGDLPFTGESYNQVLSEILLEDPAPLGAIAHDLPVELIEVVEKAMNKDRDRRYHNVQAMIHDLMPFKADSEDAMSDSAARALKSSLVPPPIATGSHMMPIIGGATLRELEFGMTDPGRRWRRRRHIVIWPSVLLVCVGLLAGLAYYIKDPEQSILESGVGIFKSAAGYWQERIGTPPSKTASAVPPKPSPLEVEATPKDTAEKGTEESAPASPDTQETSGKEIENDQTAADTAPSEVAPPPEEEVTIQLSGVPKKAKITLNGKPVSQEITLARSDTKLVLKIAANRYKPFKAKITPDESKTIEIKMEKKGRQRKGRKRR